MGSDTAVVAELGRDLKRRPVPLLMFVRGRDDDLVDWGSPLVLSLRLVARLMLKPKGLLMRQPRERRYFAGIRRRYDRETGLAGGAVLIIAVLWRVFGLDEDLEGWTVWYVGIHGRALGQRQMGVGVMVGMSALCVRLGRVVSNIAHRRRWIAVRIRRRGVGTTRGRQRESQRRGGEVAEFEIGERVRGHSSVNSGNDVNCRETGRTIGEREGRRSCRRIGSASRLSPA